MADPAHQLSRRPQSESGDDVVFLLFFLEGDKLHFYQLVLFQRRIRVLDYRFGQPTLADKHHRFKTVGKALEIFFLVPRQHD